MQNEIKAEGTPKLEEAARQCAVLVVTKPPLSNDLIVKLYEQNVANMTARFSDILRPFFPPASTPRPCVIRGCRNLAMMEGFACPSHTELDAAWNEIHCCDDVRLDQGLAVAIGDLQKARAIAEQTKAGFLAAALKRLYEETAEYIRINNLGDVHHNQAMKDARDILATSASTGEANGWERGT